MPIEDCKRAAVISWVMQLLHGLNDAKSIGIDKELF